MRRSLSPDPRTAAVSPVRQRADLSPSPPGGWVRREAAEAALVEAAGEARRWRQEAERLSVGRSEPSPATDRARADAAEHAAISAAKRVAAAEHARKVAEQSLAEVSEKLGRSDRAVVEEQRRLAEALEVVETLRHEVAAARARETDLRAAQDALSRELRESEAATAAALAAEREAHGSEMRELVDSARRRDEAAQETAVELMKLRSEAEGARTSLSEALQKAAQDREAIVHEAHKERRDDRALAARRAARSIEEAERRAGEAVDKASSQLADTQRELTEATRKALALEADVQRWRSIAESAQSAAAREAEAARAEGERAAAAEERVRVHEAAVQAAAEREVAVLDACAEGSEQVRQQCMDRAEAALADQADQAAVYHEKEMRELEDTHKKGLREERRRSSAALQQRDVEHVAEIARVREEFANERADAERLHADEIADLKRRHESSLQEQRTALLSAAEGELAAAISRQQTEYGAELASAKAALTDAERALEAERGRTADLQLELQRVREETARAVAASGDELRCRLHAAAAAEIMNVHHASGVELLELQLRHAGEREDFSERLRQHTEELRQRLESAAAESEAGRLAAEDRYAVASDDLAKAQQELVDVRQELLRAKSDRAGGAALERKLRLQVAAAHEQLRAVTSGGAHTAAAAELSEMRMSLHAQDEALVTKDLQLSHAAALLREADGELYRRAVPPPATIRVSPGRRLASPETPAPPLPASIIAELARPMVPR